MLDQICSSGSNFALLLIIAQSSSTADFGVFVILFGILTVGLGIGRTALGVPLGLDSARETVDERAVQLRLATGLAMLLGGITMSIELGATFVAGSHGLRLTGLLLALLTPFALTEDIWRYAAVTQRTPGAAALADALWLLMSGGTLLVNVVRPEPLPPEVGIATWSAGGLLALVTLALQGIRARPTLRGAGGALRDPRRRQLAGDSLVTVATPLVVASCVGLTITASAVGAVRGASTMMSPMNVLFSSVPLGVIPAAARRRDADARDLIVRITCGLAVVAAVWGALLLLLPPTWGSAILGQTWSRSRPLLPFASAETIGIAVFAGAVTLLRVRHQTKPALILRLVYAVATVLAVLAATIVVGKPVAANASMAVTATGAAVAGWWITRRGLAFRDRRSTGAHVGRHRRGGTRLVQLKRRGRH